MTTRARAQEVKALVDALKSSGRDRPDLTRPLRAGTAPCFAPCRGNGWVVCWSCGPLLPHRRPQRDRRRAGAGAGGGPPGPARPPRAGPDRDPHDRAGRRRLERGRHPRAPAAAAPAWSPTSGRRATRRTAWRCAPTSTRCRCGTAPACRGPRSTDGICHACGHDVHTAALLGAGLALAAARGRAGRTLGVAVCIFQPAEEVIPGGAARRGRRTAASTASTGSSRVHCDPARRRRARSGLREGPITAAADAVTVHARRARRPHLAPAPDRGPHLRARPRSSPTCRRCCRRRLDPRAGVSLVWGSRARRLAAQRDPVDRHGRAGRCACSTPRVGRASERWSTRSVEAVVAPYGVDGRGRARARRAAGGQRPGLHRGRLAAAARRGRSGAGRRRSHQQSLGGEDFAWYLDDGARARWPGWAPARPAAARTTCTRATCASTRRAIAVGAELLAAAPSGCAASPAGVLHNGWVNRSRRRNTNMWTGYSRRRSLERRTAARVRCRPRRDGAVGPPDAHNEKENPLASGDEDGGTRGGVRAGA